MNSEEFTIYGILPEKEAKGMIYSDKFKLLMVDYLTLGSMYNVIINILRDKLNYEELKTNEKVKIDIHHIFKSMTTKEFYTYVTPFLNKRDTQGNIKIVKVALILYTKVSSLPLLSMIEIRNAVVIFTLEEVEASVTGLPLTHSYIHSLLWKIDKCISDRVLDEWIKKCEPFLEKKGIIHAHEFLFLVCNTINRNKFFNRIPKIPLDISRTPKEHLFHVDSSGYKNLKNPDIKIQHYMTYQYSMDKAIFEGLNAANKEDVAANKKKLKNENFLKSDAENITEFKKLLRDQDLYVEVKAKLKNAYQMLNHSKLNGKSLRFQIMNEMNKNIGENQLPKEEKLTQLKNSDSYKIMERKRLKHETYDLFTKEVKFHREIMKTNEAEQESHKSLQKSRKKQRPATAKIRNVVEENYPQAKIVVKRPDSSTGLQKINNMVDDELSTYETRLLEDFTRSEKNSLSNTHIYYGSSNFLNKKSFMISGLDEICKKSYK